MDITIKKVSFEEYRKMHEYLKGKLCISRDPTNWTMTPEERKEAWEKAMNPPLPNFIDMYTADGIDRYVVQK